MSTKPGSNHWSFAFAQIKVVKHIQCHVRGQFITRDEAVWRQWNDLRIHVAVVRLRQAERVHVGIDLDLHDPQTGDLKVKASPEIKSNVI